MSNALDRFGDCLVDASEELYAAHSNADALQGAHARRATRFARALRRRPFRALAGVVAIGALSAAGSTFLGPEGNPKTTLTIKCGTSYYIPSATGNPVRDCAMRWPLLYHEPAPALVAWVASTGGAVVVVPKGAPPREGADWQRLPAGWTQDRHLVLLSHQLEDISTGLESRTCWTASSARALVRATLRSDGLSSWRIEVRKRRPEGAAPSCLLVNALLEAEGHSVEGGPVTLLKSLVKGPTHGSFRTPAGAAELRRVATIERHVNEEIAASKAACASVSRASALWRSQTQRAGLPADRFAIFPWPHPPAHRGCARIYITAPGGGGAYEVFVVG